MADELNIFLQTSELIWQIKSQMHQISSCITKVNTGMEAHQLSINELKDGFYMNNNKKE